MKILLISANTLTAPYPVYPIGLDHVAASIPDRHLVRIIDINTLKDPFQLAGKIREFGPDLIGISIRNIDNTDKTDPVGFMGTYHRVVRMVRDASEAPVVLGGSGFTLFPHRLLADLEADYGIVGEGERLRHLIEALETGRDPRGIVGILFPGEAQGPFPPPLSDHRPPVFRQSSAHRSWYIDHGAMLNLQTKRGCPFQCIYCTYPLIEGRRLRLVDPDKVARAAKSLEAAGARYLYITDSSFNANIEHSLLVARALKKAGVTIPWGAFFTPGNLPPGYFETLKDAGVKHVEFGTDALSDAVLRTYGKPFTVAQVFFAHESALSAGCHVAHYFLLGGPGETMETLDETLQNIERLDKTVLFFFCGMRVYPHTKLFQRCVEMGRLNSDTDLLEPFFYSSDGMMADTILSLVMEKSRGRDNWIIGAGGEKTAATLSRMYEKGFSGPLWEYLIH